MNEQLCQICQQPMRLIPAGISRTTGKPYNGFWACNDRTHKQQAPQPAYQAPQPIYRPQSVYQAPMVANLAPQAIIQPPKDVDWDKISFGKCKHAFLVEAFRVIFTSGNLVPSLTKEMELLAEEWATASMRQLDKSIQQKFQEAGLTPEEEQSININSF